MLPEANPAVAAIRGKSSTPTGSEESVKELLTACLMIVTLAGCESLYEDDGIPRLRTQADVDAYNATVSSESEKLVCEREFLLGSNLRQFVCMTIAQRERLVEQAREDAELLSR